MEQLQWKSQAKHGTPVDGRSGHHTHCGASVLDGDQRLMEPRTSWREMFLLNPFVGWLD